MWRDQMQPASFRGVSFGVSRASDDLGRRVVRHDYPQRDDPYVEDLGRAPRVISVTGFVVGPDYMAGRDALQEALDTPGPGTLIHPWHGSLTVCVTSARVEHSAENGGMAVFTMSFVRVRTDAAADRPLPRADYPSVAVNRGRAAALLVQDVLDASLGLAGVRDVVLNATRAALMAGLDRVGACLGLDLTGAAGWLRRVAGSSAALYDLIQSGALGASLRQLFADVADGGLSGSGGVAPGPQGFFDAARLLAPAPVPEAGITRTTAARNAAAVTSAIKRFAIVEALTGTAAVIPDTRDQAQRLRGEVVSAVDAVSIALPAAPLGDAAMAAFEDLRAAVLPALAGHAGLAPDISTFTLSRPQPSLAVAWRVAGREGIETVEADLVARNNVRHPGFVPAGKALEAVRAQE